MQTIKLQNPAYNASALKWDDPTYDPDTPLFVKESVVLGARRFKAAKCTSTTDFDYVGPSLIQPGIATAVENAEVEDNEFQIFNVYGAGINYCRYLCQETQGCLHYTVANNRCNLKGDGAVLKQLKAGKTTQGGVCTPRMPDDAQPAVAATPAPTTLWQTSYMDHARVDNAMATWDAINPGLQHVVLNDTTMDAWAKEHMAPRHYHLFKAFPLGVMRADFWRYYVVYVHGGIYADADVACKQPVARWWPAPGCSAVIGLENDLHLCQWTFAAEKHHPLLWATINLIYSVAKKEGIKVTTDHLSDDFVHHYTGPGIFTRAIIAARVASGPVETWPGQQGAHGVCFKRSTFFREEVVENLYSSQWDIGNKSWTAQVRELAKRGFETQIQR